MLKGHAKIELTNVDTGEVQVIEKDNMITNSVSEILNNRWLQLFGGASTMDSWHLPIYNKLMGGITLFSDPVVENANNTSFPEGNKVVGFAGTAASDGKNNRWGSRNLTESIAYNEETKSCTHVWDFKTDEANGTISCLALSDGIQNNYYGDHLWCPQRQYIDITSKLSSFGDDVVSFEGDTVVYIVNGAGKVTINTVQFNFDSVGLNNSMQKYKIISSVDVAMPNTTLHYGAGYGVTACCVWKDGDDGYWYGFAQMDSGFSSMETLSSGYVQIIRINKETYEMDYHNISIYALDKRYINVFTGNYLITKNYIIIPVGKTNTPVWYSEYNNPNKLSNTQVVLIDLSTWVPSLHTLTDADGKVYQMFPDHYCYHQISDAGMQNMKLGEGKYAMNHLIVNDDATVISQGHFLVNYSTGLPATFDEIVANNSESHWCSTTYVNSLYAPYYGSSSSYGYNSTFLLTQNRKHHMILWGGRKSGALQYYISPMRSNYMMSINNLETPIVKTNNQTMKITYTITEV